MAAALSTPFALQAGAAPALSRNAGRRAASAKALRKAPRRGMNVRAAYSMGAGDLTLRGPQAPEWNLPNVSAMFGGIQKMFGGGKDEPDYGYMDGGDDGMTVMRLQVGLIGSARELQQRLAKIADVADSGSEDGMHYILTETVLALMRNPEYWAYASAASASCDGPEAAESRFGSLSMEERAKIKLETLSNMDGRRRKMDDKVSGGGMTSDYILVSVIAAVDGTYRLPKITESADLKQGLVMMGGMAVDQVAAVEVIWTPESPNDVLTSEELMIDYPMLVPI